MFRSTLSLRSLLQVPLSLCLLLKDSHERETLQATKRRCLQKLLQVGLRDSMLNAGYLRCVLKLSAVITPMGTSTLHNRPKRGPGSSAAALATYPARNLSSAVTLPNTEASFLRASRRICAHDVVQRYIFRSPS